MVRQIAEFIERLNLSAPNAIVGQHFPAIVALLSIIFGGAFLLFGWRHHQYFLGVTGFLVGGWAGLMLKNHLAPAGSVAPMLYLAVCAAAGAFVCISWTRLVGILLGGFTVALVGSVFSPENYRGGDHTLSIISMSFLLGGGLGGMFPKFFFITNSSLIGSVFVTYGVSSGIVGPVAGKLDPQTQMLVHLCLFLPLLVFGILYQFTTTAERTVIVQTMPSRPAAGAHI